MPEDIFWPFCPNPEKRTDDYEWDTDVLERRTADQRIALRKYPRLQMKLNYELTPTETGMGRQLLSYSLLPDNRLLHPIWSERFFTTQELNGATNVIYGDTRFLRVRPGDFLVVWASDLDFHFVEVLENRFNRVVIQPYEFPDYTGRQLAVVPVVATRAYADFEVRYTEDVRNEVVLPVRMTEIRTYKFPISVNFSLDVSGSMDTGNRLPVLKETVTRILRYFEVLANSNMVDVFVQVNAWASDTEVRQARNGAEIAELIAYVNALETRGGTDFNAAIGPLAGFFTSAERRYNINIFVSDGQPVGDYSAAIAAVADYMDPTTGDYSTENGTAVKMYAVSIGGDGLSDLANFDNQNGAVPTVTGENVDQFLSLYVSNLFDRTTPLYKFPEFISGFSEGAVLSYKNVAKKNFKEKMDRDRRELPPRPGPDGYWDTRFINEEEIMLTFDVMDEEERYAFLVWVHSLRGQQKPFWMATPNREFRLTQPQVNTSLGRAELVVNRSALDVASRMIGTWLHIEQKNKRPQYRRIEACLGEGSTELLITLDRALPVALTPSNVAIITSLHQYRSSTDRFTLQHENHRQSRMSMTCMRIPNA